MTKEATTPQYKHIWLLSLLVFLTALLLRVLVAYVSYGGGDATNGASFSDFYLNGYDIYSTISPWPYFPFSNSFLWAWSEMSDALDISVNLAYRLFSSFFDACIATFILYYLIISDRQNALTWSLVYAVNPITVLIVSTLGFTDSFSLLFLVLAAVAFELKNSRYKYIWAGFFLAVSISAKPIALVYIPYFLYRSERLFILLISLLVSFFILNSYYFIGAPFDHVVEMLLLIFGKITSGHQSGVLGFGALSDVIGMGAIKAISVLGLLVLVIVYVLQIRSDPIDFILIIFSILLVFRYNFHLQYMAWIVPFAIISHKNIFPYLMVGGLALVAVVSSWNDSAGAFSLLSIFELDRENIESYIGFVYQYLASPILLSLGVIASILHLYNRQFYGKLLDAAKATLFLFPRTSLKQLYMLLLVSLMAGYIYLEIVSFGGPLKIGIYLRSLFLISLPTFVVYYLLLCIDIKKKKAITFVTILSFICVLTVTYFLSLQGYKKPYNAAFIYIFILAPFIIYALFSSRGSLRSLIQVERHIGRIRYTKTLRSIFILALFGVATLVVSPWDSLSHSAGHQFLFDMDGQRNLERKKYNKIKINAPKSGFLYGNNYIYHTRFDSNQYFGARNVKRIRLKLLSDSHYLLRVNGVDVSSGYGSFYYMRHSTKRKYYDYGPNMIDLDQHIKQGVNEIIVVNNLSSPVSPAGIAPTLLLDYAGGDRLEVDLTNIKWNVYKGMVDKEGNISYLNRLASQNVVKSNLRNSKYELDREDLDDFIGEDATLLAPEYSSDSRKSTLSPADIFLLLSLLLTFLSGVLLLLAQLKRIN